MFLDLVQTDKDGYKSVNYIGVVPVLVEAVKTQQKQIDEMKAQLKEIDALKKQAAENADLKKTLAAILARLEKLESGSVTSK